MKNPLFPILSDAQYHCLLEFRLLQKRKIRDIELKRQFFSLRQAGWGPQEVVSELRKDYPKLRPETKKNSVFY